MAMVAERSYARKSDPETSHWASAETSCKADSIIIWLVEQSMYNKRTGLLPREILDYFVNNPIEGIDPQSVTSRFIKLREGGFIQYKLNKYGSIVKRLSKTTGKWGRVHILGDGRVDNVFKPPSKKELDFIYITLLTFENERLQQEIKEANTIAVRIQKFRCLKRKQNSGE